MKEFDYDLVVIGSGPAGHHAAIQGAKLNQRVLLVERQSMLGGICINVGTIPSKTLREAILYLSGYREHNIYGQSYRVKEKITLQDLLFRVEPVIRHELDIMRHQLTRNGIEIAAARASFLDAHRLQLDSTSSSGHRIVSAERIVIAVGTEPANDAKLATDGRYVFSCDDILGLDDLPKTLAVIGAGVVGCEYTSMFAALGVRVTLVDLRPRLLGFVDAEIVDTLIYHMRDHRVTMRLGEEVASLEVLEDGNGRKVRTRLASGKEIVTDRALCSVGRVGATANLNLAAAGLESDERGRLKVNSSFQTPVDHIYAVGDVIGFPSLASTSKEQGRLAVCHSFGRTATQHAAFPYGIYTIPEMSFVGGTEEELTQQGVPYEVGKSHYREIARGQIIGDTTGMLKILFHRETRKVLGVHIIGEGASELIHVGQAVLSLGGTIDYFIDTVFNYPTLSECYKKAALDGINRMAS